MYSGNIFTQSNQYNIYKKKPNRINFNSLYESEKHTLDKFLPVCSSIIDIGCLNGDTLNLIKRKYDVLCTGIDIDTKAIETAKSKYKDIHFIEGDFMDINITCPKADMVIAFNLFDHFFDWKGALKNLKRFSNRFINISTLMRLNGATLLDEENNFVYYAKGKHRLLWAVHNIFELSAYAATEHINATFIYVYCYTKYDKKKFDNFNLAAHCCHAMSPQELLVGNMVIEFDDDKGMVKTKRRPDLKIILNGKVIFNSPWGRGR